MSEQQAQSGEYGVSRRREHGLMRIGIIALIVIAMLGFGAMSIQQSAWSQGYITGLIAGDGGSDAVAQYVLYNGRTFGHGSTFGFFWLLAIGFFGFMMVGKFMRMRAWHMAGGPENVDWQQQWRHGGPPWRRPHATAAPQATAPEAGQDAMPSSPAEESEASD